MSNNILNNKLDFSTKFLEQPIKKPQIKTSWCRGFLQIYSSVPTICEALDKLVVAKGTNSLCKSAFSGHSTEEQMQAIIDIMQKKVDFINLKMIADQIFVKMGDKAKVLVLRYAENLSAKQIIFLLGCSERTYYRWLSEAIKSFEFWMELELNEHPKVSRSIREHDLLLDLFGRINRFCDAYPDAPATNHLYKHVCNYVVRKIRKGA